MSLTIGSWLNKTPSDGTLLGATSRRLFWCWLLLLLFSSLEVCTFPGYFLLPPALHPRFSGPWGPPPALSSTLATFGCFTFARFIRHSFTASATVLIGHFSSRGVFYLTLLLHIFDTFCDSDARRNTPFRILLCACLHRVVPFSWRMYLNYSYCSYKTIDLSIATVIHEV